MILGLRFGVDGLSVGGTGLGCIAAFRFGDGCHKKQRIFISHEGGDVFLVLVIDVMRRQSLRREVLVVGLDFESPFHFEGGGPDA
jgi:hypothetical protein